MLSPTNKIMTNEGFSIIVERFAHDNKVPHIEALAHVVEERGIDEEAIIPMLTKSLISKIEAEARDLNILPRMNKLPGL